MTDTHHEFTVLPHHTTVGRIGPNLGRGFYQGKRDILDVNLFSDINQLKRLSLVIPCLFDAGYPTVRHTNYNGIPGNTKEIVDWENLEECTRYFGLLDLDMEIQDVLSGKEKMIKSSPRDAHVYANVDALKLEWSQYIKKNRTLPISEFRKECVPFDKVCKDAIQVTQCLENLGKHYLLFFSGCKGFRVLWYDPDLFYRVDHRDDYATAYKEQVATEYFTKIGCDEDFAKRQDHSVHDKCKGVKPDVHRHPDSNLFSFLIAYNDLLNPENPQMRKYFSLVNFDEFKLYHDVEDPDLVGLVQEYWLNLPSQCPMRIKKLRHAPPELMFKSRYNEDSMLPFPESVKRERKTDMVEHSGPSLKWSSSSSSSSSVTPYDDSFVTTSVSNNNGRYEKSDRSGLPDVEEGKSFLNADLKGKMLKWMKSKRPWVKFPEGQFPQHKLKWYGPERNCQILTFPGWNYCDIDGKDHTADKDGKVYYVVYEERIIQKCHSSDCKKVLPYAPVCLSQAAVERNEMRDKIDKNKIKYYHSLNRKIEKEAERKAASSRPTSPNSMLKRRRTSDVGRRTGGPNKFQINSSIVKPSNFVTRVDCKDFFVQQFESRWGSTSVYPITLDDRGDPDSEVGIFTANQYRSLMTNPRISQDPNLYVVVYHSDTQTCSEWGLCDFRNLTPIDEEQGGGFRVNKNACIPSPTYKQVVAKHKAKKQFPNITAFNEENQTWDLIYESDWDWAGLGFTLSHNGAWYTYTTLSRDLEMALEKRIYDNVRHCATYLASEV